MLIVSPKIIDVVKSPDFSDLFFIITARGCMGRTKIKTKVSS